MLNVPNHLSAAHCRITGRCHGQSNRQETVLILVHFQSCNTHVRARTGTHTPVCIYVYADPMSCEHISRAAMHARFHFVYYSLVYCSRVPQRDISPRHANQKPLIESTQHNAASILVRFGPQHICVPASVNSFQKPAATVMTSFKLN